MMALIDIDLTWLWDGCILLVLTLYMDVILRERKARKGSKR